MDTKIETNAKIVNGQLSNIKEILIEISNNTAYHGEGKVYASIINQINFKKIVYFKEIDYLRNLLMNEELTGNPPKLDNKKYLDRLLKN